MEFEVFQKLLIVLLALLPLTSVAIAPVPDSSGARAEIAQIGILHLGMTEHELKAVIPEKPSKGKIYRFADNGTYHQILTYEKSGITIDLSGKSPDDSERKVVVVSVTRPCSLATTKGIRIGSSKEELITVYSLENNSTYGFQGLIEEQDKITILKILVFHLENGHVSSIELNGTIPLWDRAR